MADEERGKLLNAKKLKPWWEKQVTANSNLFCAIHFWSIRFCVSDVETGFA